MDHRHLGKVARDKGGFFILGLGAVWEGVEVSHSLKYLRELGENLDWKALAMHMWHPSPLGVLAAGCAWSLGAHFWRRRQESRINTHALIDAPPLQRDVTVVEDTQLDSRTNIAEIAKVLKPGDSCEITEEVVRKRTIVLHAGQR